ncbi:hypothetical protein NFI96_028192 [Prochilodus magdalenae]|nr:hypothetical protein NFI96_028192 [Prochilodus magdalenae]
MKNCEYQQIDPQALATPTPTPAPTPSARACPEKKPRRPQRKWEVFPGKNRFYCDGRIIVARQSGVLPLTLGLILVTSGLFFIFDCPFLVQHLTGFIPVIGAVLFVVVVVSLLQTSFSDPGILPRATPEEAADIEKQIDNPTGSSSYRPPPRTKEVVINQQVVKLKYCFTCKIFRPPRTSHCSLCDNCVERFDHHCPWVGNCVGKRNYRFFYTFIVSLSFLTAFIFGCVTTHLALRSQGGNGLVFALQESPARYPLPLTPDVQVSIRTCWRLTSLQTRTLSGTPLSRVPGTPLSRASGTPLSRVPGTPLSRVPGTPLSRVPGTPLSRVPGTPLSRVRGTPLSRVRGTPLSRVRGTPLSRVRGTPLSRAPGTPLFRVFQIKGSWSGKSGSEETGNPYSYNSIFKNCCSVLCGPMPPSLIDRRGFVPSEDLAEMDPAEIQLPAAKTDINMVGRVPEPGRAPVLPPPTLTLHQPTLTIQNHSTA